jgi:3-isopropylmalate/(R)-2-methylmalate dehydratase small subunit
MGKVVLKLGDDISTDIIYPGRFMATILPTETPKYAFGDIEEFNIKLKNGEVPENSIIVAGNNFGCGSSREQAASCLKGNGLIVIAKGFSRIFLQNAINVGLKVIICPEIEANDGDEIEIKDEEVINKTKMKIFKVQSLPESRKAIIEEGGLIPYTRKKLFERIKKTFVAQDLK